MGTFAMTLLQAFLYGLSFGFTEFLPWSASSHLYGLQNYFGWNSIPKPLMGTIGFGCWIALLIFTYIKREKSKRHLPNAKTLLILIALTMIPLGITFGLFMPKFVVQKFSNSFVSIANLMGGLVFAIGYFLNKDHKSLKELTLLDAMGFGLFQSFLIIPGVGRQCMALGYLLIRNYRKESLIWFSFVSLIPMLFGTSLFGIIPLIQNFTGSDIPWFLTAFLSSSVSAFLGLSLIERFFTNKNFAYTSIGYRIFIIAILLFL